MAIILKPLGALILFGLVALPVRLAVDRYMKESKLKRVLLIRLDRRGRG